MNPDEILTENGYVSRMKHTSLSVKKLRPELLASMMKDMSRIVSNTSHRTILQRYITLQSLNETTRASSFYTEIKSKPTI